MVPLLHRQPFRAVFLTGFLVVTLLQLPCWLIYYSWPPNRPRKSWTLRRAIHVRVLRNLTQLPLKFGVSDGRNLSLEVPQEELESLNARFVWIPELEKEDIVGVIAEHATRAGISSIAIPAYWILKDGIKWSPAHDEAGKDERVILYIHGGGFVVSFFSPSHCLRTNSFDRRGPPTRPIEQHPLSREYWNILHLSPEYFRSTTGSVLDLLLSAGTHFRLRSWT